MAGVDDEWKILFRKRAVPYIVLLVELFPNVEINFDPAL